MYIYIYIHTYHDISYSWIMKWTQSSNPPVNSRGMLGAKVLAKNFKLVPKPYQTITKYLKVGSPHGIEPPKTSIWDKTKILPNQGPNPKNCLKTSNTMVCKQSFLNIPLLFFIFRHEFEVFRGSGGPIRSEFEVFREAHVKPIRSEFEVVSWQKKCKPKKLSKNLSHHGIQTILLKYIPIFWIFVGIFWLLYLRF